MLVPYNFSLYLTVAKYIWGNLLKNPASEFSDNRICMSRKNAECTIAKRVIIIVISNSCARQWCVLSDENEDRAKTGKRLKGKRRNENVEESTEERYRLHARVCVCVPGYQEQRDARSQTYEEAIVHEHFAPVTRARQWPPLTRPVTVSLFADNA